MSSAGEEMHCNGGGGGGSSAKDPRGGISADGIITYKRKRARSSTPPVPIQPKKEIEVSAPAAASGEVFHKLPKKRNKDIGWDHGLHVEGNRYRWQCKWCGIVRSGGVSRLKQHLAGAPQVRKCPEVPTNIAETMKKHLNPGVLKAIDAINSRSRYVDDFIDKDHSFTSQGNASLRFRKCNNHFEAGENLSRSTAQQSEMAVVKASENPVAVLPMSIYEQGGLDRTDSHGIYASEHLLQLPDMSGIQSCIGPSVFTSPFKERHQDHDEVHNHSQRLGSSAGAASDVSKTGTFIHADINNSKILSSKKYILLRDLIFGTFQDKKASEILDFSLINTKIKNGDYERSPGLFDQDFQQVGDKIQKIGQELLLFANNLSNISVASCENQDGEDLEHEDGEQKFEDTCQVGIEQRNSMDSNTIQFPSSESDRSTKPDVTQASFLYKICTCKQCGIDADGKHSLICDGCEAMYHLSCIEPAQEKIPTQSWYCTDCITNRKEPPEPLTNRTETSEPVINIRETPEPVFTSIQRDGLHDNCVVCDRLEVSETPELPTEIANMAAVSIDSRESSVSSMESDELPEPSMTAMLRLCKKCGTCEDENKRMLVCENTHCPYKFYHIRCLKFSQAACMQSRWYCPSCLCRACLTDKDDDKIVLCDHCDEAYHLYCMKPPRSSIPKGQWYCISCNVERAKEGMRRYELMILQQHAKKDAIPANVMNRSLDMLLNAAEKLSSEDRVAVGGKDR